MNFRKAFAAGLGGVLGVIVGAAGMSYLIGRVAETRIKGAFAEVENYLREKTEESLRDAPTRDDGV